MEWKDVTNYSRDDKERIPLVLEFIAGTLRIAIHRHIHYEKDRWLVSCHSLNIDKVPLNNKDLERAKLEGLAYVNGIIQTYSLLQRLIETEMKRLRSNSANAKTNSD